MIFKCKNCGGNVVYKPEKDVMYCPFCDSENSVEKTDESMGEITVCPNCGGEITVGPHTSATRCPSCDCYLILDERVSGDYAPRTIIPFRISKETCKDSLRKQFQTYRFAPTDFLAEAKLNEMEGIYVPFWFYDYDIHWDYQGEGRKVRSWTSGDTAYTETSYYDVKRDMDIQFRQIPVDASEQMPDDVMDLVEPFDYSQMRDFSPEYISGFYAEKYNMLCNSVEGRARKKMQEDSEQLLQNSYSAYSALSTLHKDMQIKSSRADFGLLPVWRYRYTYKGQEYPFYLNGQTGKIVGTPPISQGKVWLYSGTVWACLTALLVLIQMIFMYLY